MKPRALMVALVVALFAVWQVAARVGPVALTVHVRPGTPRAVVQNAASSSATARPARATGPYALDRPDTVLVWQAHRYVRGTSGSVTYFTVPPESLPVFDGGKRYLMRIRNGDTTGANSGRVSRAYVQVNGQEVMSSSDLGTSIASCVKVIRPATSTTLVIGVSGTAGRYADVTLYETPDPSYELRSPQAFVMGVPPEEVTPDGEFTEFTDVVVRGSGDLGPYHLFIRNGLEDGTLRCSGVRVYVGGTLVVGSGTVNSNVGEYARQVSLPYATTGLTVRLYGDVGTQATLWFTATDATEPELTVLAPQQGLMTQQDTTTIRFRTNDQTVLDSVLVNGVPASPAGQDAAGSLWSYAATVPNQGRNEFVIRARNRAGYACDSLRTVIRDNFAPVLTVDSLPEASPLTVATSTITVRGHWHDSTPTIVTVDGDTVSAAADSGEFAISVPLDMGSNGIHLRAVDHFGQTTEFKRFVVREIDNEQVQPDPSPSTHSPTEVASFFDRVKFLWTGVGSVQTGVAAGTIDDSLASVLRGRVFGRDVGALANVIVRVVGHAEYGQTLTRADGAFDLAVNAGAPLTLEFAKTDFLPAQRAVEPALLDFVQVPDVALLGRSTRQYHVNTDSTRKIVSRFESDLNGDRRLTLIFQQGTRCTVSVGDTTTTTTDFHVRAKEYTVGADGEEAMPGTLPPSSAYTYCVNLSTVEGDNLAGSGPQARVSFDRPVVTYVREFIGARVGMAVPSGSYDFTTGRWMPSEDGLIVRIKGRGRALSNIDSDTLVANKDSLRNVALGFTEDEVELITNEYAVGDSLWRVRLTHFSPHDYNFNREAIAAAQAMSPGSITSMGTIITDPDLTCACVIENENRVLGETIPIVGTPYSLHYRSSRQPGDVSMRWLRIPMLGSASDAALKRVHVTVDVAGRRFKRSFTPGEAATPWEFRDWNGTDVYGRPVVGSITATVRRGYEFEEKMLVLPGNGFRSDFASPARVATPGQPSTGDRAVGRILWTTQQVAIGVPNMAAAGLGGWTMTPHHIYDPNGMGMKYRGDGTMQRGAAQFPVIKAWAGNGQGGGATAEGPLNTTSISAIGTISHGPDGALYVANDHQADVMENTDVIMRLTDAGGVERITGGSGSFTNGAIATSVGGFKALSSAVAAPDGSVYFCESASGKDAVYRITPGTAATRKIWHFAGDHTKPFYDDSLATGVGFGQPKSIALGPDGAVFIGAKLGSAPVILRVAVDGRVARYAGAGNGSAGSNGLARSIAIVDPTAMVVDAGGNLYFTESTGGAVDRIRRVSPDGMLSTLYSANAISPTCLAVGTDQQLYFGRSYAPGGSTSGVMAVYRLESDGTASVVVGGNAPNGNFASQDGAFARGALFSSIRGIAFNSRGEMFISSVPGGISKVYSEIPTQVAGELVHPSADGRVMDVFSSTGRHLRTLDANSGLALFRFGYDAGGRLTSIVDSNGDSTRIQRSALGAPEQIVAPRGQITTLALNGDYLHTVTNPADEVTTVSMGPGGLLDSFTNARGQSWTYTFGLDDGRLDAEREPGASFSRTLAPSPPGATRTVTHESPGQRTTRYDVTQMLDGLRNRAIRYPDGSVTTQAQVFLTASPYGEQVTTTANTGEISISRPRRDPRFGWWAAVDSFESVELPYSHQRRVVARTRSWGAQVTEQTVVNGKTYASSYDTAQRRLTTTTPVGRVSRVYFDAAGRPLTLEVPGLNNVSLHYDSHGQLDHLSQGARSWDYAYDALGQLTSVTNQLDDATLYDVHDGAGRVKSLRLPGQRQVRFGYDAVGNLDSLTTPNNTTHTFAYTPTNLNGTYSPPPVDGVPNPSTSYEYDPDHLLKKVTRPDGGIVDLEYAAATGQLAHAEFPSAGSTTPRWQVDYSYWNGPPSGSTPGGGLLRSANRVGMAAVEYGYDGSLPTRERWTGRVQGAIGRTYDAFFRPATDTVSAGDVARAVIYGYDDDGLLTDIDAGDGSWSYALHHSTTTGMLDSTHVAPASGVAVTSSADYDLYGDLTNLRYSVGGTELFLQSIHHDARGRVDVISERWNGGTPKVTSYGYDAAGRLASVTENSVLRREYEYDANGNRTKETRRDSLGGVEVVSVGAYDPQDRLLTYGTGAGVPEEGLAAGDSLVFEGYHAYAYTANGELTSRTLNSPGTTGLAGTYTYDAMGALVAAGRPAAGGTDSVAFALDGQHRRVAAYRSGAFERGWLYEGISVVAELSDSVTLAHRFVYGTRDHVPDLMWDADSAIAYRLVTDHLGSVRAVVRLTDGAIVQRTDYDAWGEVTAETNPELQSLGFAGGLRERTTGLVRFGARDYDASVGRWTSKDPSKFLRLNTNFYQYVEGTPIEAADPSGLWTYYGNFGGPHHTNGGEKYREDDHFPQHPGHPGFKWPRDLRDELYRQHDVDLARCARIKDPVLRRQCRRESDRALALKIARFEEDHPECRKWLTWLAEFWFFYPGWSPNNNDGEHVQ